MSTVLITGANRGLGLEFARSYAADGWRVHACCRHPEKAKALKAVEGDVAYHKLDVTDGLRVAGLARELADEAIDVLLNNAGVYGPRGGFGGFRLNGFSTGLGFGGLCLFRKPAGPAFFPFLGLAVLGCLVLVETSERHPQG